MQLSFFEVSIVLLFIWSVAYFLTRSKISTAKVYFVLLAIMASPALFFKKLPLMGLQPEIFNMANILLFAFLMLVVLIPWFIFDKWHLKKPVFVLKEQYIKTMQYVFRITILLSLAATIYFIPYTINGYIMGAQEMRVMLQNEFILPPTILTTIAIAVATFSPIVILFVFISLLNQKLGKYTIWLVLSSLTYCFANIAIGGRDGLVYTPLTYIVLFAVFRYSINKQQMKKIKTFAKIFICCFLLMIGVQTYDRFYESSYVSDQAFNDVLYGSWGYFYQQPFVFNHVMEQFHSFYGFKRRLMFMDSILDVPGQEYAANNMIEFMFGTQFADFYEISGYDSLIICSIFYLLIFGTLIYNYRKKKKIFHMLVVFTMYVYFTISGLFYFRFGGNNSEFFMYMFIIYGVCLVPNFMSVNYLTDIHLKETTCISDNP